MSHQQTVYLIDTDPPDRHSLAFELGNLGVEAWPFASGADFLDALDHLRPECIILAMEDPEAGLKLMGELLRRDINWPVIGLSRSGDLRAAVEAMKLGAFEFLSRPIDFDALLGALAHAALALQNVLQADQLRHKAEERVQCLTARELDISIALVRGQANKTIAHELGISVRTVEAHRANIMMKLGVRSLPELVLLVTEAGIAVAPIALGPPRGPLPPRPVQSRSTVTPLRRAPDPLRRISGAG